MKHSQYILGLAIGLICSVSPLSAMVENQQNTYEPFMTQNLENIFPAEIGSLKVDASFVRKENYGRYEVTLKSQNGGRFDITLYVSLDKFDLKDEKEKAGLKTFEEYVRFVLEINKEEPNTNNLEHNLREILIFFQHECSEEMSYKKETLYQIVELYLFGTMRENHHRVLGIQQIINQNYSFFNKANRDYIYRKILNHVVEKYKRMLAEDNFSSASYFSIISNLYFELIDPAQNIWWAKENIGASLKDIITQIDNVGDSLEEIKIKMKVELVNKLLINFQRDLSRENIEICIKYKADIVNIVEKKNSDRFTLDSAISEETLSKFAWILQGEPNIGEQSKNYIKRYKEIEAGGTVEEKTRMLNILLELYRYSTHLNEHNRFVSCIDFLRKIDKNNTNIQLNTINAGIKGNLLFTCLLLSRHLDLLKQFLDSLQAKDNGERLVDDYINKPILSEGQFDVSKYGIDIRLARGETPLIFAAAQGDRELMELLINRGAKINHVRERSSKEKEKMCVTGVRDDSHRTALVAVLEELEDDKEDASNILRYLIEQGALCQHESACGRIYVGEEGDAICAAIKHKKRKMLKIILDHIMQESPENLLVSVRRVSRQNYVSAVEYFGGDDAIKGLVSEALGKAEAQVAEKSPENLLVSEGSSCQQNTSDNCVSAVTHVGGDDTTKGLVSEALGKAEAQVAEKSPENLLVSEGSVSESPSCRQSTPSNYVDAVVGDGTTKGLVSETLDGSKAQVSNNRPFRLLKKQVSKVLDFFADLLNNKWW